MTPSPFVVGAPRSGTTLLRLVLDAHRDLAIPPETGFLLELTARPPRDADAFVEVVSGFPREAPTWPDFGIDRAALARHWRDYVLATRSASGSVGQLLEIRFEDLVRHPERTVAQLVELLSLDSDDAMLRHHERAEVRLAEHGARRRVDGSEHVSLERRRAQQATTRRALDSSKIGAHLTLLTADERREFEAVAGDLLVELGYRV